MASNIQTDILLYMHLNHTVENKKLLSYPASYTDSIANYVFDY